MLTQLVQNIHLRKTVALLTLLVSAIYAYIDSDDIISIKLDFYKVFQKDGSGFGGGNTPSDGDDPYFSDLFKTFKVQRMMLDGDKHK